MKNIFFCLLLLLSGLLTAQTIENPTFKARNGSIRNITRIERTLSTLKSIFTPFSVRTGGLWKTEKTIWRMPPPANATHKRAPKASN